MLTRDDIDAMTQDERWLGHGYLQGRTIMLTSTDAEAPADPERVDEVDYEQMFEWANSGYGRWFADSVYGRDEPVWEAIRQCRL